jgi:hypothetical protein
MSADMVDDTRLIDQWVASDQSKPRHLHVSEQGLNLRPFASHAVPTDMMSES